MIPLDNFQEWSKKIDDTSLFDVFSDNDKNDFLKIPADERRNLLKYFFENPADLIMFNCWYTWNKWKEALRTLKNQPSLRLLELASGANVGIPRVMSVAYNHPDTCYVTANTNKALTHWFREGTKDLSININIIENEAQKIEDLTQKESFDIVALEHSVNDIIYDMLARKNGIDTVNKEWIEVHQDMVNITNEEISRGTLESSVKDELLGIISSCLNVLKKDSYIIINHFMYQYDLDRGINYSFWENLLPMFRKWVNDAGIGQEIFLDGFESNWWMFIKKI